MSLRIVFMVVGIGEAIGGVGFLFAPALTAGQLFGTEATGVALPLARIVGAALLSIGLACWLARKDADSQAARGLAVAMLLYNVLVLIGLGAACIGGAFSGSGMVSAIFTHVLFTIGFALGLAKGPTAAPA